MGLIKKLSNLMGVPDDDEVDGYDDYGDDMNFINGQQSGYNAADQDDRYDAQETAAQPKRNKVVNINAKRTVVLNLESTNKDISRRLVDFLSGVAYANNGQIKRVANSTFIITPYNVDIMGDLLDELESNGVFF